LRRQVIVMSSSIGASRFRPGRTPVGEGKFGVFIAPANFVAFLPDGVDGPIPAQIGCGVRPRTPKQPNAARRAFFDVIRQACETTADAVAGVFANDLTVVVAGFGAVRCRRDNLLSALTNQGGQGSENRSSPTTPAIAITAPWRGRSTRAPRAQVICSYPAASGDYSSFPQAVLGPRALSWRLAPPPKAPSAERIARHAAGLGRIFFRAGLSRDKAGGGKENPRIDVPGLQCCSKNSPESDVALIKAKSMPNRWANLTYIKSARGIFIL